MARVVWEPVLDRAKAIVDTYNTGVTLRQLFYRLVAADLIPNTANYYRQLSARTARGRREGWFPDLLDRTSRVEQFEFFSSPAEARERMRKTYRRDRTEGQDWTIMLGVEKAGMSAQLDAWFTDLLGIPHVALGGYASQTLCDEVRRHVLAHGRDAVLIYAGDMDPTGEDIDRDFAERVGAFDKVIRVALDREQVDTYNLPFTFDPEVMAKLGRDTRAAGFLERHDGLVQYEVDALEPEVLRSLYADAIAQFLDVDLLRQVVAREDEEREQL